MTMLVCDQAQFDQILRERRARGQDRFDEVWDGVYIMSPIPNDEHQDLSNGLASFLTDVVRWSGLGKVREGTNISDRTKDWTQNFRCPDIAVFLNECAAISYPAFWHGGPDFAIEIISPNDRTRAKFDFYAKVATRELLIIDRAPWALELYALCDGQLVLAGKSTPDDSATLTSMILPVTFRLVPGETRPQVECRRTDGDLIRLV